jgi:hypothetical protein
MTFQPPDWWYLPWVGEWSCVEAPIDEHVDLDCATLTPTAEKEEERHGTIPQVDER